MTKRYKVSEEERLTEFCTHFWGLFMTKRLSSLRLFPSISQSGVISFLAPLVLSSKGYPVHSTSLPIHSIFCWDAHEARCQVLSFLSSPLLHQVVLVGEGRSWKAEPLVLLPLGSVRKHLACQEYSPNISPVFFENFRWTYCNVC